MKSPLQTHYLLGDISGATVFPLIIDLSTSQPPILVIHSSGGDEMLAWSLFAALRRSSAIATIGLATVSSAATIPYLAARRRWLFRDALCCLHNGKSEISEKSSYQELQAWTDNIKRMHERYYRLLSRSTKRPLSFWRNFFAGEKEYWLEAKEMLRLGLATNLF